MLLAGPPPVESTDVGVAILHHLLDKYAEYTITRVAPTKWTPTHVWVVIVRKDRQFRLTVQDDQLVAEQVIGPDHNSTLNEIMRFDLTQPSCFDQLDVMLKLATLLQ